MPTDPTPTPKASADEVRAALAAATPGPWWHQVTTACFDVIQGGERTSDSNYIAMMGTDYDGHDTLDAPNVRADAHLIANAPTWLAQLLAALEASERENVRLREALITIKEWGARSRVQQDGKTAGLMAERALAPSTPPDPREDI